MSTLYLVWNILLKRDLSFFQKTVCGQMSRMDIETITRIVVMSVFYWRGWVLCARSANGCSWFLDYIIRSSEQSLRWWAFTTFFCDVTDCTFEANSSSSLKRHKVSHSAALLHCDFTRCSYETKDPSNLKRHKLNHTSGFKCDFNECHFETNTESKLKRHSVTHSDETFKYDFNECHF